MHRRDSIIVCADQICSPRLAMSFAACHSLFLACPLSLSRMAIVHACTLPPFQARYFSFRPPPITSLTPSPSPAPVQSSVSLSFTLDYAHNSRSLFPFRSSSPSPSPSTHPVVPGHPCGHIHQRRELFPLQVATPALIPVTS